MTVLVQRTLGYSPEDANAGYKKERHEDEDEEGKKTVSCCYPPCPEMPPSYNVRIRRS